MKLSKLAVEKAKYLLHVVLSLLAELYYQFPARSMHIIAVTGTSGKSTTASMIHFLLEKADIEVGLISTLGVSIGNYKLPTGLHVTTPGSVELQKILRMLKERGAKYIVLEVSSHALAQGRLGLMPIDFAIFTNITSDHLDYHKTWEDYANAKAGLLKKLHSKGTAFLNSNDQKSFEFLKNYIFAEKLNTLKIIEYSISELVNPKSDLNGLKFEYKEANFDIPVLGDYNYGNALASIKVAEHLGIPTGQLTHNFHKFSEIVGRMNIILKTPFTVIINFAHNADSLEKSLTFIKGNIPEGKRLIVVFGSAGLRDREKRFTMGKVAGSIADITIVTAEDPRTESLYDINTKIIEGAEVGGGTLLARFNSHQEYLNYMPEFKDINNAILSFDEESVNSRYDAVEFALGIANPGDIVILEGKGHEQSLCFGTTEYAYTDYDAIHKALSISEIS